MEGLSLMQGHVETDFASGKNQWGMCVSNIKLQTLDGTCVNQSLGVKLYLLLVFFVFLPLFETKIGWTHMVHTLLFSLNVFAQNIFYLYIYIGSLFDITNYKLQIFCRLIMKDLELGTFSANDSTDHDKASPNKQQVSRQMFCCTWCSKESNSCTDTSNTGDTTQKANR